MRKLLLTLLLLAVIGCTEADWERLNSPDGRTEAERAEVRARAKRADDLVASLKDGRVHIGMTDTKFARLWGKPQDRYIDRSTSLYGITEWWKFGAYYGYDCRPYDGYGTPAYYFCFENGILTYWSEN